MFRDFRPLTAPVASAMVAMLLITAWGCSQAPPKAEPKPEVKQEKVPVEPEPKPADPEPTPKEPVPEPTKPEPMPADDRAAGKTGDETGEERAADGDNFAALLATLIDTADSRTRVLTIDEIATRRGGALPALDPLVKSLEDAEPRVRWHAARAIGLIGDKAATAIPALVKLLQDDDAIAVTQAAAAIGHIRADDRREEIPAADAAVYAAAIEPLVGTTLHPDPRARRAALRALSELSTSPQDLSRVVRRQLADADPSAVLPALHTLADMGDDAVPFLLEALEDPQTRYWAEVVIAELGPKAAAAAEPLTKLVDNGQIEERVQAILALAAIGEPAAGAAPKLVEALASPDASLRYVAAYALGKLGAKEGDAALEQAAAGDDPFMVSLASWARARLHPDDADLRAVAVERLQAGLADESPAVRNGAVEGMSDLAGRLDAAARRELATKFAALLADPVPGVGLAAGGALIRLGPDAVDALRATLQKPTVRGDAMEILAELGPAALPALDDMIAGLADPDPDYRSESAVALAAIGPAAEAAVPPLEKALADEQADPSTRYSAAYALGRIGTAALAAEPMLRKLAESEDELMATVAVWAALKIRPTDRTLFDAAVPKLRRALQRDREIIRLEAAVALGEIGPAAKTAIPMLEMLAEEDPSRTVRDAAAAAVEKIAPTP